MKMFCFEMDKEDSTKRGGGMTASVPAKIQTDISQIQQALLPEKT
jgi:hypothetical protein